MKKIFTLVLSMGLLTATFAQDGHHSKSATVKQSYNSRFQKAPGFQKERSASYAKAGIGKYRVNERKKEFNKRKFDHRLAMRPAHLVKRCVK